MNISSKIKKIWNITTNALVAIVVIIAVLLAGARLIGLKVYTVLSGSMEPVYHTGSIIYVKSVDPNTIEVGDPITFVINESLVVATHRVIDIDEENMFFYTKGDANDVADASPVPFENLIGKPVFTIPYLGFLANFIQQPPGLYIAIAAGALLMLLCFVPDVIDLVRQARSEKEEAKAENDDKEELSEMSNEEIINELLNRLPEDTKE